MSHRGRLKKGADSPFLYGEAIARSSAGACAYPARDKHEGIIRAYRLRDNAHRAMMKTLREKNGGAKYGKMWNAYPSLEG